MSAPTTPSLDKTMSDLSLKQMREHLTSGSSSSTQRLTRSISSNSGSSSGRAAKSGLVPQQLFANNPGSSGGGSANNVTPASGPLTSGLVCRPSTSQSLLMRYAPANSTSNTAGPVTPGAGLSAYRNTRSALHSKDRPAGLSASMTIQGSASKEAVVGALLSSSIASLRATLHTDKLTAADRPKVQPGSVISQSSDFVESGWRSPISAAGSYGSLSSSNSRPGTGVARVLAPNGQPRKVPVAALAGMLPAPAAAATMSAGKAGLLQGPGTPQHTSAGRLNAYYSSN